MNTISHDTLLFNLHDLILLMSVFLYLVLAVTFSIYAYRDSNKTYLILATILTLFAAQSVDTLIIWSEPIRLLVLNLQPSLIFWGGVGFWLQGPLLLWLVRSVTDPNFKLSRLSSLHLLPALIVVGLLLLKYHSLPKSMQIENMNNLTFMWSAFMENLVTARYLSMIGYGGWCLAELTHKRRQVVNQNEYKLRVYFWLPWVIPGSIIISGWPLLVHLIGNRIPLSVANIMGLGTNYLTFVFITTLVFITLRSSQFIRSIETDKAEAPTPNIENIIASVTEEYSPIKPDLIKRLESYMTYEKPFLESNINLEILAKRLSLPERTLSRIVNQHFKQNFVEFTNRYRIMEAKKLLVAQEYKDKSILTIMADAGFNSKSTFNSTFKQQVGMTPSQFRKANIKAEVTVVSGGH